MDLVNSLFKQIATNKFNWWQTWWHQYANFKFKKPLNALHCAIKRLFCDHGRSRTLNLQSRNLTLYPIELRGRFECANIQIF